MTLKDLIKELQELCNKGFEYHEVVYKSYTTENLDINEVIVTDHDIKLIE